MNSLNPQLHPGQHRPSLSSVQLTGDQSLSVDSAFVWLDTIGERSADSPLYVVAIGTDAQELRTQGRDAVALAFPSAIPSGKEWSALPPRPLIVIGSTPQHTEALAKSAKDAGRAARGRIRIPGMKASVLEQQSAAETAEALFGMLVEESCPTPALKLISRDELEDLPEQQWLIDGVLPKDAVGMLFGDPGVGKSFIALSMATSVATGVGWYGRNCTRGDVVYVAAEGLSGQRNRLAAWEGLNGLRVERIFFLGETVNFLEPERAATELLEAMAAYSVQPELIVIDTLARSMPGGEENSARDVGLLVDGAESLRKETGATVLFIHHANKAGGYRGSSALLGAVSTSIEASRGDRLEVRVGCHKQKDAEPFETMRFHLERHGESLVPMLQGTIRPELAGGPLSLLEALQEAGQPLKNAEWQKASGVPKRTFNRYVGILKDKGAVQYLDGTYQVVPEVPNECHGTGGPGEDRVSASGATTLRGGTVAPLPSLGDVA